MESRLRGAAGVDWRDYEFVLPRAEERLDSTLELTGWETVVFEVEDDEEGGEP